MPDRNKNKILTKKAVENSHQITNYEKAKTKQSTPASNNGEAYFITYSDYKIESETALGRVGGLGHAGVLISAHNGLTKYYDYGRFKTSDGTKGKVKNWRVPNAKLGKDGISVESLSKIFDVLSQGSGQNGRIEAVRFKNLDFKKMNEYAYQKFKESNIGNPEYNKNRKPYGLTSNNCGHFAESVIEKGGDIAKPIIVNPSPINFVDEYWEEGYDKYIFDPQTKEIQIKP